MNYVLRNKLLTPLEFLQEHFNPDPETIQIIISCTFSPVQADMGTDCNKTHCMEVDIWGWVVGRLSWHWEHCAPFIFLIFTWGIWHSQQWLFYYAAYVPVIRVLCFILKSLLLRVEVIFSFSVCLCCARVCPCIFLCVWIVSVNVSLAFSRGSSVYLGFCVLYSPFYFVRVFSCLVSYSPVLCLMSTFPTCVITCPHPNVFLLCQLSPPTSAPSSCVLYLHPLFSMFSARSPCSIGPSIPAIFLEFPVNYHCVVCSRATWFDFCLPSFIPLACGFVFFFSLYLPDGLLGWASVCV